MKYALIPLLPFAAFLIIGLFGHWIRERAHWIAVPAVGISFLLSAWIFTEVAKGEPIHVTLYSWIASGAFDVSIGLYIDRLTAAMLLLVTIVSGLVHVYTIGYMHGEPGYARFFAYVALFTFSMLMLVMADNFLQLYVFWEAVGLCSYLIIGHWYERKTACDAATKAFVVNRVGDFGFGLGVMLIFAVFGSLQYDQVFNHAVLIEGQTINLLKPLGGQWPVEVMTVICLLLFAGAVGKSAQVPLHVWLPDAMEGPTPVSALIHAATMVTAGIYMVARSHALFERSVIAMDVVAWIGVATALFAATVALVQTDIKRVLAYSTVSQLGYMFAAVGLGAYAAGIFHLVTHAFFKALLFLGAGSVIHGLGGEQDLRKMGGLSSRMVTTTITTTVGAAGLAGVPGLAGFFSKDEILAAAFGGGHRGMWALLLLGAFLTAFYASRLLFLAFYGAPRMSKEAAHHLHESPSVMTLPLWALAVLTAVAGLAVGIPSERGTRFARLLEPVLPLHAEAHSGSVSYMLLILSVVVVAAGITLAWFMYVSSPVRVKTIGRPRTPLHALLLNAYYVDRLYDWIIVRPFFRLSTVLARAFDLG